MKKSIIPIMAISALLFACNDDTASVGSQSEYLTVTKEVTAACSNSFTPDLLQLPFSITVDTASDPTAGQSFDADIFASITLDEDTVATILDNLPGLSVVTISTAQVQVSPESGATGPSLVSSIPRQTIDLDTDTDGNGEPGPFEFVGSVETGTFNVTGASGTNIVFDFDGDAFGSGIGNGPGESPSGAEATILIFITVTFPCESGTWTEDPATGDLIEPLIPTPTADKLNIPII